MEKKLLELKFNCSGNGIFYLAEAVTIRNKDFRIKMMDIYSLVAKKFKTTSNRVERSIRHCIETSENKYKTLSNSEVINSLIIELK